MVDKRVSRDSGESIGKEPLLGQVRPVQIPAGQVHPVEVQSSGAQIRAWLPYLWTTCVVVFAIGRSIGTRKSSVRQAPAHDVDSRLGRPTHGTKCFRCYSPPAVEESPCQLHR